MPNTISPIEATTSGATRYSLRRRSVLMRVTAALPCNRPLRRMQQRAGTRRAGYRDHQRIAVGPAPAVVDPEGRASVGDFRRCRKYAEAIFARRYRDPVETQVDFVFPGTIGDRHEVFVEQDLPAVPYSHGLERIADGDRNVL